MFWRREEIPRPPATRYSTGRPLAVWERYLERGIAAFEKESYEDALADLDEAIENTPNLGELYATRGLILHLMRRDEDSEEDLAHALNLDSHQWLVFYVQGLIAMRNKNHEEAIEYFSRAQRYVPTRPEILHSRAMAYYGYGNLDAAIGDLKLAVDTMDSKDKQLKEIKRLLKVMEDEQK